MYIGFRNVRYVIVDHQFQVVYINSAGCNISGYQYTCNAFLKFSVLSGVHSATCYRVWLRHVYGFAEHPGYFVSTMLGLGKYQRRPDVSFAGANAEAGISYPDVR